MSMKYKLLLCVVVLLACTATLFAGTTTIWQQTFAAANANLKSTDATYNLNYTKWTLQGNWAVIDPVTKKPGIPADTLTTDTAGLVYNQNGDYTANIQPAQYVTTLPIDCSANTGVQLSFLRSLTVEDAQFDQATVWVTATESTPGVPLFGTTPVYKNPTDSTVTKITDHTMNLTDANWHLVSYDISSIADGKKTVYLRWGIASNGDNKNGGSTTVPNLHGWAIQDITLTGAAADAFYAPVLGNTTFPSGFVASGPIWQIGGTSVGSSGQTRSDATDPSGKVGKDPAANAAGTLGGTVIGTVLGGNYPAGMSAAGVGINNAPQYLTWGPLDLTGLQKTALRFQRWLNIGNGSTDYVSIQALVGNSSLDNPDDPVTVKEDTTANTINVSTAKVVYPMGTTGYYAQGGLLGGGSGNDALTVTFKYNTDTLADGNAEELRFQYTLNNSKSSPTWVTFTGANGTITTNTDNSDSNSGVEQVVFDSANFASNADYILAQSNANFAVRAILSKSDGTALDSSSTAVAIISDAKVMAVPWATLWANPAAAETLDDIGDGKAAWSTQMYSLPSGSDGNADVWVRWSIGPTDSGFNTEYGGWNIDQPQIVEASREWMAVSDALPANGLVWDTTGPVTMTAKNTGTAPWDKTFSAYEVKGVPASPPNLGEPGKTVQGVALAAPPSPIARWSVDSIPVSGSIATDSTFAFKANLLAPPLSSVVYATPQFSTVAADATLSALDADWDLANETFLGDQDWLPTYRGGSIANGSVVTSRFSDDAPNSAGNWARFWTEELAGRVPFVVQGFGGGQYRPTNAIARDAIAVYMARAKNLATDDATILTYGGPHFSDVPTDYWAYNSVEACLHAGIVSGFPDHTYHPTDQIFRDAMAKYIVLAANIPAFAAPVATDQASQDAAVAAGWFKDVQLFDNSTTSVKANVFRDYISALSHDAIVTGYPYKDKNGNTAYTYLAPDGQTAKAVDRASLAVYVWRAFMRDQASVVVLGGPAITDVALATDGAAPAGIAGYYGYSDAGSTFTSGPFGSVDTPTAKYTARLAMSTDINYAYVTFDALRFAGTNLAAAVGVNGLDVQFQLVPVNGTTSVVVATGTVNVPVATLTQWVNDVKAGNGEPYRNVVWQIPTGLQGDYQLVVQVEGKTVAYQPFYSVRNGIFAEGFDEDSDFGLWADYGQPASGPDIYPLDAEAAGNLKAADANTDLFKGTGSIELQGTQQIVRVFPTTNRHNIRLGLRFAALKLGSNDTINVEWSYDFGTGTTSPHWAAVSGMPIKGSVPPPTALQKNPVYFNLPNGDPTADPSVIGADNNPAMAIRLSISTTASAARAYFDTLTIDGT